MDDEVVFQNSALHQHLNSVGFDDGDVTPESITKEFPDEPPQHPDEEHGRNAESDTGVFNQKVTFWMKIKNSIGKAFWDDAWNDQLTQVHNKHADEVTDGILQSPILEEEDGMYIESFYTSMQSYRPDANQTETSIMGVVMMQMAILSVSLAYAGFRMVYLKSPDITSRYYIWSIDIIAVLLTIASLTPTTVKSASAGRTISRLKEFSKTAQSFLKEVDTLYRLNRKAVKLVQEMELVQRGFTMVSPVTPVTRLEQGDIQPSRRQCPKLRRMVFHTSRSIMLNVKRSAQHLLRNFPPHVEIDGVSSYLANQPLHHYGPCVYISGKDMEDKLRAVTEDYSLASIKAMVELCHLHISELLRVLAMSCLTQAEEHDKNPSYKMQKVILETLLSRFQEQLKPYMKLYTLHKSLNTAKEKKEQDRANRKNVTQTSTESLYVAVHSLSLHLQAAMSRIEKLEADLETAVDKEESNTKEAGKAQCLPVIQDVQGKLDGIKSELDSCQDCLEESQIRAGKINSSSGGSSTKGDMNDSKSTASSSNQVSTEDQPAPLPIFDMGDPVIEDQVFQDYASTEETGTSVTDTDFFLSEEDRAKKKEEKREAVRVLKELKKVIAVRAVEYEERERQAFLRQYPDAKFEDPIQSLRRQCSTNLTTATNPDVDDTSNSATSDQLIGSAGQSDCLQEEQTDFETGHLESTENIHNETVDCGYEGNAVGTGDMGIGNVSLPDIDKPIEDCLRDRLAGLGGANFPFSTELAAQAVAQSHKMAAMSEETFGGNDSDELSEGDSAQGDDEWPDPKVENLAREL